MTAEDRDQFRNPTLASSMGLHLPLPYLVTMKALIFRRADAKGSDVPSLPGVVVDTEKVSSSVFALVGDRKDTAALKSSH